MKMELKDLKDRWAEYDRRLDAGLRLNTELLRESRLDKADTRLGRMSRWIALELAGCVVVALLLGGFIYDHLDQPAFLAPAVLLQLYQIGLIVSCVRQLARIGGIDYDAPVVAIQGELGKLRIQRARATKWTWLLAPLLWVPLLVVLTKGLLGIDVYAILDPTWLTVNVLFGAAFIPLMLWLSKRHADRFKDSAILQGLMDDLAGRNLKAATEFLDQLSRFER